MASNRNGSKGIQTVEIDREALSRLEDARGEGETYSEVIKRHIRPRQSAEEILRTMRKAQLASSTLKSIEESVARRRQAPHKSKG